ncbi:MAG: S8 family serine peptidase [Bacteroidia bacterium]
MLRTKTIGFTLFLGILSASAIIAQTKTPAKNAPHFRMAENVKPGDYMEKTIIVKVKSAYAGICSSNKIENEVFKKLYAELGGNSLEKTFPHTKAPEREYNERGEKLIDLTHIYHFHYTLNVNLEKAINMIATAGIFEYVEPYYIPKIDFTPNDPMLGSQYAITRINAPNAWGVAGPGAQGDTNVVIGITDTGTELTHSDLSSQIKINPLDLPGGGDTDGDGYVDNYHGWDLGDNDNDPTWTGDSHGVHVSGIAAAATNNSNGIAGVGFKCKFLPVKIANTAGTLTMAYQGITYAADHGCAVINCSWGGAGGGSFGQDVVTYATINKNALVVVAAGNTGTDVGQFPAAYQYALSVVNTNSTDHKDPSSTYNYTCDICAPGTSILSTLPVNTYGNLTGTSMASPCVAGAAAIVKSYFPSYTGLQVGERLKVTAYNIYPLHSPIYANKLGNGRLDLYNALIAPNTPSVLMTSRTDTDGNDNTFVIGDTIQMRGNYTNYLAPTVNLTATVTSTSGFVSSVDGTTTLGAIPTLGVANNNADPFRFRILPSAPLNTPIPFKIVYNDASTSYTATEFFTIIVNVDYVNITINDVATSIGSNGRVGYSQNGQTGGLGFNYMGAGTLLYEAGLMIGKDTGHVSDCVRSWSTPSADFQSVVTAHAVVPAVVSEFDVDGTFNDNLATLPLPVLVHHKAFAWSTPGNTKYVIVQYTIKNTGSSSLSGIYSGIFADWDIDATTFAENRAAVDVANRLGYAYYTGTAGKYCGVKLLTTTAPFVHYAVDNVAGGGGAGAADLSDGYSGGEKYQTMTTNRAAAGASGTGADVCDIVSTGPYVIAAGDSIKVAFALIAGDNLSDLTTSAVNAQTMYDGLGMTTEVPNIVSDDVNAMTTFPNPANGTSNIVVSVSVDSKIELKVFNMLGEEMSSIASENVQAGSHKYTYETSGLAGGMYYYQLTVGSKKYVQKLMVNK